LDRLLASVSGLHPLTQLKRDPKDFSLGDMRQEIERATELRPLAQVAERLVPHLDISNEGLKYYASLVSYYSVFRLRQLGTRTAYLYVLCFAFHRHQRVHDHLLTCFLHKVKQYGDEAKAMAKERISAQRTADQRDLPKAGAVLKLFTTEQVDAATPFSAVQARAFAILDRPRLDRVAAHLAKAAAFDETALHWEHVDKLAPQFKRHLRPLLLAVEIAAAQPETPLLAAIAFLKMAFAKGCPLSKVADGAVPTRCIPKRLRRYLYAQTGRGPRRLLADRYEFWVYRLLRHGLEAGELSCRQGVVTLTRLRRLLISRHIDTRLFSPLGQRVDVSSALLCLPHSRRLGHVSPGLQACSHLLPVGCCSQEMPPGSEVRRDHAEGGEEALG